MKIHHFEKKVYVCKNTIIQWISKIKIKSKMTSLNEIESWKAVLVFETQKDVFLFRTGNEGLTFGGAVFFVIGFVQLQQRKENDFLII